MAEENERAHRAIEEVFEKNYLRSGAAAVKKKDSRMLLVNMGNHNMALELCK